MSNLVSRFVDVQYVFYALADPRTDHVRYVGRTRMPLARFTSHLRNRTGLLAKKAWVSKLHAAGLEPRVVALEVGWYSSITSSRRETQWIQHFLNLGCSLLNGEAIGRRRRTDCAPRAVQRV